MKKIKVYYDENSETLFVLYINKKKKFYIESLENKMCISSGIAGFINEQCFFIGYL